MYMPDNMMIGRALNSEAQLELYQMFIYIHILRILNPEQRILIEIVVFGRDVFAELPTEFGRF